jgi:hypothetical protein
VRTAAKAVTLVVNERPPVAGLRVYDVLGGRRSGVEIGEHVVVVRGLLPVCDCTASAHSPCSHVVAVDGALRRVPRLRLGLTQEIERGVWPPVMVRCEKHRRCWKISNVTWAEIPCSEYIGRSRHAESSVSLITALKRLGVPHDADIICDEAAQIDDIRQRSRRRADEERAAQAKALVRAERVGDRIEIRSSYDPTIIDLIRTIDGRKWDPQAGAWSIPLAGAMPLAEAFAVVGIAHDDLAAIAMGWTG